MSQTKQDYCAHIGKYGNWRRGVTEDIHLSHL